MIVVDKWVVSLSVAMQGAAIATMIDALPNKAERTALWRELALPRPRRARA